MNRPVPLFARLLIIIIGFGAITGFLMGMDALSRKIADEKERRQLVINDRNLYFQKQAKIIITEVMSSNSLTIADGYGTSSDWIEFYNSGEEIINLKGAGLSTNVDEPMFWVFPDFEIGSKEYKIVFASGLDEVDSAGSPHLNFRLNAEIGETLYFTSALGTLITEIALPALESDISYGLSEQGNWLFFNHPTPNQKNGADGKPDPDFSVAIDSPLRITEYMTDNRSTLIDEDGDIGDWVEFYNESDGPFSLAGLFFSDDKTDLRKWAFPDIVINPRSYLVVFASGKDKVSENVHTNFRLSENETMIVSTRYSEIIVEVTTELLPEDVSRGVQGGEWFYFSEPTPGQENSTHGYNGISLLPAKDIDVLINEVMTRNVDFLADETGNFYDWIELKNNTTRDINLEGYSVSKDSHGQERYLFSDYVIPAQGYAVFFMDVVADANGTNNILPFSLSASGETLHLCSVDCKEQQVFLTGLLGKNVSSGLNETGERVFYENPTPGEPNSTISEKRYSQSVRYSIKGGEVSYGQLLTLSSEEGSTIFYTLDGSLPSISDFLYVDPIMLDASTTVRAISLVEGELTSPVTTQTYVVGTKHDLPIIALSLEPDQLLGWKGIYTNPFQDIEVPVHVEFYETDDSLAFSFDAGVEIFGGYSQADPQKSFTVHLRKEYGTDQITFPLFENNEVTSFKHFILRTSGQDATMTKIRDAFIHKAIKDVIDIEVMDSRPCVVYINGEYWGLYNLREKVNEDYLASHFGTEPGKVDLLVYNGLALAGSNEAYNQLIDFVAANDLSIQANYEYVASQVDIDNLIDYLIVQSYFGNTDSGNIKFWRDQDGGKWRWIVYDMDWALFMDTYNWNNLAQIFNPNGMGVSDWIDTTLHVKLMENPQFRSEFIQRYALYINTIFSPERLLPIFNAMVADIEQEMPRHLLRWPKPSGSASWEKHVASMRQIIIEKPELEKTHLQEFFNLSGEEMSKLFP